MAAILSQSWMLIFFFDAHPPRDAGFACSAGALHVKLSVLGYALEYTDTVEDCRISWNQVLGILSSRKRSGNQLRETIQIL